MDECPVFNIEWQHLQSGPSPANEYIVVNVDDCVGVGWGHHIALEVDWGGVNLGTAMPADLAALSQN